MTDETKTALLSKLRAPVADERAAFHLARKVELLEQVAHYADLCCAFLRDAGYAGKADALTSRIKAVIDLDGQISPPLADERAAENHFEDELERAYWEMDARIKGLGKHKGRPQPDRDAFKWAVRGMRPTPPKPPKPVPERICICCNVPRNNCDCEPEAAALASAPVAGEVQPTDAEIIDLAVEPLGIDCDRMPHGVVVFARSLLSRYAAPQASEAVRNARAEGFLAGLDQALEVLEHDDFATRLQSAQVIRTLKSQSSALSAQSELSSGAPNGRKRTAAERRAPMVERVYGTGVTAQPAQKEQRDEN